MNRYIVAGLLADIRAGKTVIFASEHTENAWTFHECLAQLGEDEPSRVIRSSARQQIDLPSGGSLTFSSTAPSALRERTADVLYLTTWADARLGVDLYATGAFGEIIRGS